MGYQIEILDCDNEADACEKAERLSSCNVDGVDSTIWLNACRPKYVYVVDHFHPPRGWDVGSIDPEDAVGGFSLLIELAAKTESGARRVAEEVCAKTRVAGCKLLEDLEGGVDEYDVSAGWRDGLNEDAER
jgi:hypothetical protein